ASACTMHGQINLQEIAAPTYPADARASNALTPHVRAVRRVHVLNRSSNQRRGWPSQAWPSPSRRRMTPWICWWALIIAIEGRLDLGTFVDPEFAAPLKGEITRCGPADLGAVVDQCFGRCITPRQGDPSLLDLQPRGPPRQVLCTYRPLMGFHGTQVATPYLLAGLTQHDTRPPRPPNTMVMPRFRFRGRRLMFFCCCDTGADATPQAYGA